MLKQFDVYRNSSPRTNMHTPYFVIVQDDYYQEFATRVIVPLIRRAKLPVWHESVAPKINLEFEKLVLYSPMVTHLEVARLRSQDFVCNLRGARNDVVAAIDSLITNV